MQLTEIISFLEANYPVSKRSPDDPVGLQITRSQQVVNRVLVALDLTSAVVEMAITSNVELILVHHPFLWMPTLEQEFLVAPHKKKLLEELRQHDIALYVLHSNFNNVLAGMPLALSEFFAWTPLAKHSDPYLSFFQVPQNYNLGSFIPYLKMIFRIQVVECYLPPNFDLAKALSTFCMLPGKGPIEAIIKAWGEKPDFIVTSDVKWSEWVTIRELGIPVLNISHAMENVFSSWIQKVLTSNFVSLQVSTLEIEPVTRFV